MLHNITVVKTVVVGVVGNTGNILLSAAYAVAITKQLNIDQSVYQKFILSWFPRYFNI